MKLISDNDEGFCDHVAVQMKNQNVLLSVFSHFKISIDTGTQDS